MADELRLQPALPDSHLSIASGAGTYTPPASASFVLLQAVGGDCRYTISGTPASASVGLVVYNRGGKELVATGPMVVIKYYVPSGATLEVQPVQTIRSGV